MEEGDVKIGGVLCSLIILTACSSNDPGLREESDEQPNAQETIIKNLNVPWEIVRSENTFYLTERSGVIATFENSLERESLQLSKSVHSEGEGGLLGMALANDFSQTKTAFLYHTYLENGKTFNRVIKVELEGDTWKETKELIANIPGSQFHNGGRLKIGPDRMLYITTGDAANPQLAQDKKSLAGKILRMDVEGNVPEDNPFDDSYVYSYGHRNPQGLAWDENGQLYSSEHGQSAHDEINQIDAGKNYGWPVIEGDEVADGMEHPLYQSGEDTWAPSGMVFQEDNLYVACLRGEEIRSFQLNGHGTKIVKEGIGRVRSIYQDKATLYAITNNKDGRGTPDKGDDHMVKVSLDK